MFFPISSQILFKHASIHAVLTLELLLFSKTLSYCMGEPSNDKTETTQAYDSWLTSVSLIHASI